VTIAYFIRRLRTWGENLLASSNEIVYGMVARTQRAFVEMRHKLSADERDEQERGGENQGGYDHGYLRVVEAPVELSRILFAQPFKRLVHALVHARLNQ
jgi:hypothetical protein